MDGTALDVLGRLLPSLALIVGALLLVRRWAQRQNGGAVSGVRVVARTGVTRGAVVAVVTYGGRRFLIGAGEQGVSLLSELGPADASDADDRLSPTWDHSPHAATDSAAASRHPATTGPWMGLIDRLRAMTVRTHLEGPIRASRG